MRTSPPAKTIRTEAVIDASPEAVWEVLTDLPAYREWNPHVIDAWGILREGTDVAIRIQQSGSNRRAMTVRVTAVEPPRRLQWVGHVLTRWLFEGRHTFELEPLDDGRTRFVNSERLSGLLVPLVVGADAERQYEAMNRALAERAERRVSTPEQGGRER